MMAETVTMPKLGFDMAEGTLVRWVKAIGEIVNKGEVLAEIETDKATVEVESNSTGVVAQHLVDQGAVVPVGTPIAIITKPGETAPAVVSVSTIVPEQKAVPIAVPLPQKLTATETLERKESAPVKTMLEASVLPAGMLKASPLARRIAQDKGIDLRQINGTGPEGRIVRKDVEEAAISPVKPEIATPKPVQASQPAAFIPRPVGEDEHIHVDKLRAAIGRRMTESKQTIPNFYVTLDVDTARLVQLRTEINGLLPEEQKISFNDFIVKAAALALQQFPNLNASLKGEELVHHAHIHIGVAVAVEGGLLTVVVKDANQKSVRMISEEVKGMAARVRLGKVRSDDIEGSTFSISNLGMYNVDQFTAIINPPEAAILAVGAIQQTPVIENGQVVVGSRMKITLSADHRITDGAEAARFMQALKKLVETPLNLLI